MREQLINKLKSLIEEYKKSEFSYLTCGSKEFSHINADGELIYKQKTPQKIEEIKKSRTEFEQLTNSITDLFYELYKTREVPKYIIGCDTYARYIGKDDNFLYSFTDEIFESALSKKDPTLIVYIAQIMELPLYYISPVAEIIKTVCKDILPSIAIACDADLSIYINNIKSRFCVLNTKANFHKLYAESISQQKADLIQKYISESSHIKQ